MKAPDFWYRDGWVSKLLTPLSVLWCWGAEYRQSGIETYRAAIPVICVGNIVAGGTGKTPTVLALSKFLKSWGKKVHLLTRGYGGSLPGPVRVDPAKHDAKLVGDEALLLAQSAPTWVSRWRPDGAAAASTHGANVLIMDDGFQNFTLSKDLSFVVVDGAVGFGNGRVMPAGPCREPIQDGLARADAVILIGQDAKNITAMVGDIPIIHARLQPDSGAYFLAGKRVLAFAGIGRPQKFFTLLETEIKAQLVDTISFPDHHAYSPGDVETLVTQARLLDAVPVTTRKDWVKLPPAFQSQVTVIDVTLEFQDEALLATLLQKVLL
jgi:tetraacyldisaccharide 4'-kinase